MRRTDKEIKRLREFLGSQPHERKIFVAGNHDWGFQTKAAVTRRYFSGVTYLQDSAVVIDGVKFYGSPWQPEFYDWAFNLPRGLKLAEKWAQIPGDVDVLITHGPPQGILDEICGEQVGCEELLRAVRRVKPKVHAFGHIHASYGMTKIDETLFVNASICGEDYVPRNAPVVVDLSSDGAAVSIF